MISLSLQHPLQVQVAVVTHVLLLHPACHAQWV